jgi:hypothetical protein
LASVRRRHYGIIFAIGVMTVSMYEDSCGPWTVAGATHPVFQFQIKPEQKLNRSQRLEVRHQAAIGSAGSPSGKVCLCAVR